MHGYGVGLRIEQISKGVFQVNAGSLFPAFRRLERQGWIRGEWRASENNRRAKYYVLTDAGRKQLKSEAANGRPRVRPSRESWKRLPEKRDAYLQNSVSARPVAPQLLTVGLSPRRAVLGIAEC